MEVMSMNNILVSMKKSVLGPMCGIKKLNFKHLTPTATCSGSIQIRLWIFCLLVAAVGLFGMEVPVSLAASYYVSTTGNDSYAGTSLKPFRTMQKAANVTKPGDTVIVKNGTYTTTKGDRVLNITRAGTSSAYITFKAENIGGAIIDGRSNATNYGIVVMPTAAYIKIEGFELRGFRGFGIEAYQSHDVVIRNNHIYNIGRVTIADCNALYGSAGVFTSPTSYKISIEGNSIHDIGRLPDSCQEHAYRHDHGLYLQGKYMTVRQNAFYNHKAGWAIKVDGYWGTEVGASENSHVIAENIFQPDVRSDKDGGGNIRFFNNATYSSTYGNMKPPKNVLIENNSFYRPDGLGYKSAIIISNNANSNFKGTVLRNNKTSSKYLYCEYLGSAITSNVTVLNNKVNAYDSLFTSAERVNP